jgi:hypothetical protein
MCECPICHELFSGERTFVAHRIDGAWSGRPAAQFLGDCHDPATKGMALNEHGVWSNPASRPDGTVEGDGGGEATPGRVRALAASQTAVAA